MFWSLHLGFLTSVCVFWLRDALPLWLCAFGASWIRRRQLSWWEWTSSAQSLSLISVVASGIMMVPPDPLNRHILPCRLAYSSAIVMPPRLALAGKSTVNQIYCYISMKVLISKPVWINFSRKFFSETLSNVLQSSLTNFIIQSGENKALKVVQHDLFL